MTIDCYMGQIFEKQSKLVVCVNSSNEIVVLDYFLTVLKKIEGVPGTPFIKSFSQSSTTVSSQDEAFFNWLKGNHQSALIDIETFEEIDRGPLFGTVTTYADYLPLLSAYSQKRWCGVHYKKDCFEFGWISEDQKVVTRLEKVIPEAEKVLSLHLSKDGRYVIVLIATNKELSLASIILVSLSFGNTFPLIDYRRVKSSSINFTPTVSKDREGNCFVLNSGNDLSVYEITESGKFDLKGEVLQITTGRRWFNNREYY